MAAAAAATATTTQLVSDDWLYGGVGGAVRSVYTAYNDIFKRADTRVDGYFLMESPVPTALICLLYVFIVKVAGPKFMEKREPYQLKNIIVVYNFLQVIISTYIFIEFGMGGWMRGYSYTCQPVDYSDSAIGHRMLFASYLYYLSKFSEFFDTFFFVLRKKNQHVSLLHVIHHGMMPFSTWIGVKFTPGGHSTFFGFINTFVHIFMYLYYMVAAMGPQYQKYIWWKKYLTTMQIVQFVLIFVHAFQLCFRECDYPRVFVWWIGGHAVMFFILFSDFYVNAYRNLSYKAHGKSSTFFTISVGKIVPCFLPSVEEASSKKDVNGNAKSLLNDHPNGYANGYANGHANSQVNGYANGHLPINKDKEEQKTTVSTRQRRTRKET